MTDNLTDDQRRRVHACTYSTDDREEVCERVVLLQDLCADLLGRLEAADAATDMGWLDARMAERARELGVEA